MLRRRQGRRRPETLFGGHGILRVVAASEHERQRRNPDGRQNSVAHGGSLQIALYNAQSRSMFMASA